MKAWGLTISIPCDKCDKNCSYCISEMTGFVKSNPRLVKRNLRKVFTYAKNAGIETVLITSKREPLLNFKMVIKMCRLFRGYNVEIQTNGLMLKRKPKLLRKLLNFGTFPPTLLKLGKGLKLIKMLKIKIKTKIYEFFSNRSIIYG